MNTRKFTPSSSDIASIGRVDPSLTAEVLANIIKDRYKVQRQPQEEMPEPIIIDSSVKQGEQCASQIK